MSPTRPTLRIRPRSGIADADLARLATTELPGLPTRLRGLGPRKLLELVRSPERVLEPDRVIVMPLTPATAPHATPGRRRGRRGTR